MADDDFTVTDQTPHIEHAQRVAAAFAAVTRREDEADLALLKHRVQSDNGARIPLDDVISEHHFLYGDAPHPRTVAHTEAVVDRIHALKPPSLVRMDRAEDALAAVVARRKLEQHGQILTDDWWDLKRYEDSLVDRYIEAES